MLSDRTIELVARRFRMLGEPMRLRILQVLESGDYTVGEIVTAIEASQSNVSRHLLALHQAGIVSRRQVANSVFYSIADPMVIKICRMVCRSTAENDGV